ncbi:MAG: ATP synthase subunit I [Clostridia bacterium]|nr:ATP synthase subunit I [Clostridia bacterium]
MKNDSVYKDASKVCLVILLLSIVEFIIFSVFLSFRIDILIGVVYGCAFTCANFFYLAYSVKKSLEKGPAGAKTQMAMSYNARLLLTACMVILAAKVEAIHFWAAIIPIVFQRIATHIVSIQSSHNKKGSENS